MGGVKICPLRCFGHWLVQQLVVP